MAETNISMSRMESALRKRVTQTLKKEAADMMEKLKPLTYANGNKCVLIERDFADREVGRVSISWVSLGSQLSEQYVAFHLESRVTQEIDNLFKRVEQVAELQQLVDEMRI